MKKQMKSLILCGVTLWGFGATFAAASCQTLNFPNGANFCLDIHKTSSTSFEVRTSNARLQNLSNLTCQISLPNGKIVKLPNCQGTFYYDGNQGKIEVEADTDEGFSMLVANYDFSRGEFNNGNYSDSSSSNNSSQSYQNYQIELSNPSTSNPSTSERIDAIIKVRYNGSSYSYDTFNGRVDLAVEEYRNGRWQSASSADFSLEKSSVYFSSSDRGEIRINRLLSFRNRGEFRLIATINQTNASAYQTFYVNSNGSSTNNRRDWNDRRDQDYRYANLSLKLDYDSRWYTDERSKTIDAEIRLDDYYRGTIFFELEEYRNGRWQEASRRDYDFDRTSFYFDGYEKSRKFNALLKIYNRDGNYRLLARTENGKRTTEEIRFSTSSTRNSRDTQTSTSLNYTNAEFRKLKSVYEIWPSVIQTLKKDYPKLRNHSQWNRESEEFYNNMKDAVNGNRFAKFESRSTFYKAFGNWLSLTIRVRGF